MVISAAHPSFEASDLPLQVILSRGEGSRRLQRASRPVVLTPSSGEIPGPSSLDDLSRNRAGRW